MYFAKKIYIKNQIKTSYNKLISYLNKYNIYLLNNIFFIIKYKFIQI